VSLEISIATKLFFTAEFFPTVVIMVTELLLPTTGVTDMLLAITGVAELLPITGFPSALVVTGVTEVSVPLRVFTVGLTGTVTEVLLTVTAGVDGTVAAGLKEITEDKKLLFRVEATKVVTLAEGAGWRLEDEPATFLLVLAEGGFLGYEATETITCGSRPYFPLVRLARLLEFFLVVTVVTATWPPVLSSLLLASPRGSGRRVGGLG
jgi:hypothetical protein